MAGSISSVRTFNALRPTPPSALGRMAKASVPSELKAQGSAGDLDAVARLTNHVAQSYLHIEPAKEALVALPKAITSGSGGAAIGQVGQVLGHAGFLSGGISLILSAFTHFERVTNHQESTQTAMKAVAVDTAAGAGGGMGAALAAGATTALVGALGLAGAPLTILGIVAGFIGYTWGDNLVRSFLR